MARITVSDSFEESEVDIFGTVYKTIPVTRSVENAAVELEKTSGGVLEDEKASPTAKFEYLAKVLALRLRPVEVDEPPVDVLALGLYEEDKLRSDQLIGLLEQLGEQENPTT